MADNAFSQNNNQVTEKSFSLEKIFHVAINQNLPIAIWRLPESDNIQACISFDAALSIEQPDIEQSPFGFLFCPFIVSQEYPNLFIKADLEYSSATGALKPAAHVAEEKWRSFYEQLDQLDEIIPVNWHYPLTITPSSEQSETGYRAAVEAGIDAIRKEQMEKVVLSRCKTEVLSTNFRPVAAYRRMLASYPRAFVSLVSIPGIGTWLGASPEILVSIDENQIFRTVALAGTQHTDGETSLANAIWRQKEIEEQGMVERYILSCFKKLRLREYTEIGPRTVIAGELMHLRTDYKVDLQEVYFPTLGTDMLHLLHPTSAICGLPKEPAMEFIKAHESYNRSYYSGYLGPVNYKTNTHLFVNLRCMQILQDKAVLYAGAGITGESSPEKEYQETHYKMQTMRKVLNFEVVN